MNRFIQWIFEQCKSILFQRGYNIALISVIPCKLIFVHKNRDDIVWLVRGYESQYDWGYHVYPRLIASKTWLDGYSAISDVVHGESE